jgi:hypothetical protein
LLSSISYGSIRSSVLWLNNNVLFHKDKYLRVSENVCILMTAFQELISE